MTGQDEKLHRILDIEEGRKLGGVWFPVRPPPYSGIRTWCPPESRTPRCYLRVPGRGREIRRKPGEIGSVERDGDRCDAPIERVSMGSSERIEALGPLLSDLQASVALRTCKNCGSVLPTPGPVILDECE